jgi:glycosyltransferase involved in cell wall biosynthesis
VKILQINSGQHLNGALVHTFLLSRELVAQGHEVHVVCHPQHWLWQQCQTHDIPCCPSTMRRQWSEIRRVAQYARRHDIEVLHTHMSRAHFFGVLLRAATGLPCVATAHSCHFQLHWWWNDFVIANSEASCRYHRRYNFVPPQRIQTIYCTSDLEHFRHVTVDQRIAIRQRARVSPDQLVVGVVGEVTRRKGQHELLRALPDLRARFPQLQVWLVGRADRQSKYVQSLRRDLYRQSLWGCVKWWGRQANVAPWMAAMDILVVPSLAEPLGLVALEGQAVGTPVVVTDVGGLPEIVQHESNGLIVPPRQPAALTQAIVRLVSDPALAQRIVRGGHEQVENFSLSRLTHQVVACLHRVVLSRR